MLLRSSAVLVCLALVVGCSPSRTSGRDVVPPPLTGAPAGWSAVTWPVHGQASYALGGELHSSPGQRPVPIASVAKVMTALVAVRRLPASARVVVDAAAVADTSRRARRGESVVRLRAGEVLTRDQALTALLLPSANNVAALLAERVSGSWSGFLALMNATARDLGMRQTTYTDPSGYQPSTVSTARDQLLLLRVVLKEPTLARVMGLQSAVLPVAGRVVSTNRLLGTDGFVAGKTGSTSAAGGCLVFRVVRGGRVLDGAVLGQPGPRLVDAGLAAASDLARQALAA